MYNDNQPGILTDAGVIDIGDLCPDGGQAAIVHLIANYDDLKSQLESRAAEGTPVADAQLQAPLPRPNKILCMGGNYREFGAREPSPMWGFTKRHHSIMGPGGNVVLPDVDANIFHHEAELVLVFGRGGKDIPASEAMDYVFGYTAGVDVSARMPAGGGGRGRAQHAAHLGAQIAPHLLSPCVDGELRVNYNTDDLAHSIAESIEYVAAIEEISPGDVLFMGTNHQGLGAMQDGDTIAVGVEGVGSFNLTVSDPLKRRWPKGVDETTARDIRESAGGPGRQARPLPAE
ncbi:Uncharacterized protein PH0643 [Geodia barretti]|uniref:oxaloacetate tautomerase n=1 Tax=Geodia barretti TaxID=519541 RepID=A0AA35SCS9_GEOBA|nr:Uncharacterized protein PH0643 [Geodia barretti]